MAVFLLYPCLNLFSVGYLLLSTALAVLQAVVNQRFSSSEDIQRLFYAKDIDRVWDRYVALLGSAEFAVFYEYSHGRVMPELIRPSVQIAGLLLCLTGTLWLFWVDAYLLGQFSAHYRRGALMTSGPYRYVRHPRYLGLLATRLALLLLFGSVIAGVLAVLWFLLVRRRARLEEKLFKRQVW